MSKKTFGQTIRELRCERGLTKRDICGDETALSIRQLTRLEADRSKPTLTKIRYLADKLEVPSYVLMEDYQELPQEYLNLKYQVLRMEGFGDQKRRQIKDSCLEKIYDYYYEDLPEEEQLMLDVFCAGRDVFITERAEFGDSILQEYFEQIRSKRLYTVNDVLVIKVHILSCLVNQDLFDKGVFHHLITSLLSQGEHFPMEYLFMLKNLLVTCAGLAMMMEEYAYLTPLLKEVKELTHASQDYQNLAIIKLMEWKVAFLLEKDEPKAERLYEEAVQFSRLIEDSYLEGKLKEEWEADLVSFRR
ncbi:hypothetical protein AB1I63_05145 [Streptococcus pneumoniae]